MKTLLLLYKKSFSNLSPEIWTLSIILLINRVGSMVLTFCTLYMVNELKITPLDAAWVMMFFGGGSIIGSYLGGIAADRFSPKWVMFFSLVSGSLVLLLLLFTTNLYALAAIIFFHALLADSFRPSNAVGISTFSQPEDRTRSFSLQRLAINLGFTIGPAIGGWIAYHYGYKNLFIIDVCTSLLAAIFLAWKLPEFKKDKPADPAAEASGLSAYRNTNYILFILLVVVYALVFFQLIFTIPIYFNKADHYSEDIIGYLLGFNGLIVVLVEMPFIAQYGNRKNYFVFIAIGASLLIISFLLLLLAKGNYLISILFIILMSLSEIFAMPFMMTHAINSSPPSRQGQYTSLYSIAYGIAFIFAPYIGLKFADHFGMNAMLYLIVTLSFALTISFIAFKKYIINGKS
jgi:predicted MFS family arabinose efflux permease